MDIIIGSFIALTAGILLNVMPCVLPIIPLKAQAVIKTVDHHWQRRLLAASLFLLGTLIFFWILAVLVGSLNLFWGSLFQSTLFLWGITIFFFIAGITLWLNYVIPLPQQLLVFKARGYWEPFLSGFFVAILSTPCTGPFLGGVIAFALTQSLWLTLWFFAWIAIGLALPLMIVILFPQLLAYVPRQREWTQVVKQFLGWILIAAGAYFIVSLLPTFWIMLIHYLLFVLFFIWLIVVWIKAKEWPTRGLTIGLAIIALSLLYLYAWPRQIATLHWQPYSQQLFASAQQQKRPVLIEFTADWCINCKVLEKTVYRDQIVLNAAKQTHLLTLQVDLTHSNPGHESLLKQWGGAGLPYAVVFNQEGIIVQRLPDLFRARTLAKAILVTGGKR